MSGSFRASGLDDRPIILRDYPRPSGEFPFHFCSGSGVVMPYWLGPDPLVRLDAPTASSREGRAESC